MSWLSQVVDAKAQNHAIFPDKNCAGLSSLEIPPLPSVVADTLRAGGTYLRLRNTVVQNELS